MNEYDTQHVCEDCFILLANGDISPDLPQEQADALLSKFEGFHAIPLDGVDPYSTRACDGCGSPFYGARYDVAIEPVEPQHADYPHEPGTLYDCPACESTCYCMNTADIEPCVRCAIEGESAMHDANV